MSRSPEAHSQLQLLHPIVPLLLSLSIVPATAICHRYYSVRPSPPCHVLLALPSRLSLQGSRRSPSRRGKLTTVITVLAIIVASHAMTNHLMPHSRSSAPMQPLPPNVVGYSNGKASHTCNRLSVSYHLIRRTAETTHDRIPDIYISSGGPSSVGVMSNAASVPTIINHMFAWARRRPGHRRTPKPNAVVG